MECFKIRVLFPAGDLLESLKSVSCRVFSERGWPDLQFPFDAVEADLEWTRDATVAPQGFRIETAATGGIRIAAADARGLFYGMGKFMRRSRRDEAAFVACPWRGTSVPRLSMRGIYFATHFHNFYQEAPVDKVTAYIADLALLGFNALNVWFDMHHYAGIGSPEAQAMLERLRMLLQTARRVGMSAGIGVLANEGYRTTPAALRATGTGRAHYGVEVCVASPEGKALVLKNIADELDAFQSTGLDFIWLWPYDQGGCACPACGPWGRNGMLRIGPEISRLFRARFPGGKVILSTWLFDYGHDQGEWEGLANAFSTPPDWVDYLLADSHDHFPRFPLERGIPGNLPLLNFPEISMYGMTPWGGFGANPLIRRMATLWGEIAHLADGGFPYSEGIFEDLNKVVCAAFYWTAQNDCQAALDEYFQFAFGASVPADCRRILEILESNHGPVWMTGAMVRKWGVPAGAVPVQGYSDGTVQQPRSHADAVLAAEALALCRRVDVTLPEWGRKAWRWRIIFLRATLDHALICNGNQPTEDCQAAFHELQDIYSAQSTEAIVAPPLRGIVRKEDSTNCE